MFHGDARSQRGGLHENDVTFSRSKREKKINPNDIVRVIMEPIPLLYCVPHREFERRILEPTQGFIKY